MMPNAKDAMEERVGRPNWDIEAGLYELNVQTRFLSLCRDFYYSGMKVIPMGQGIRVFWHVYRKAIIGGRKGNGPVSCLV